MRRPKKEIQLTSYDELLGLEESPEKSMNQVVEIELEKLHPFKNHPFHVSDDEKMAETVESIKNYGVLNPALVRPRSEGGYELISGHRRKRGCELCGKTTMPVLVRNYTDDEAVIIMVDSNIQRENILPSEKVHAYKMKYDAMKHQGSKGEKYTADAPYYMEEGSNEMKKIIDNLAYSRGYKYSLHALIDMSIKYFNMIYNKNSPTSSGSEMNCRFEHKCS